MWFLYVLTGLYLFIPVLRVFVRGASPKDLAYFIFRWLFAVTVAPFTAAIGKILGKHVQFGINLSMMAGHSGYLMLGYVVGRAKIWKRWLYCAAILYATGFCITAAGTFLIYKWMHFFGWVFYQLLTPNVILMAAGSFYLIKYAGRRISRNSRAAQSVKVFSEASFGIYLLHPILIDLLLEANTGAIFNIIPSNSIYMIPIASISVFLMSFFLVRAIAAVPILRRIV
jgi:surface polysaccharide O-acyltransferase-like enzyme